MSERRTALDLRIVQAEAKLKRTCKDQNKMEMYVEPPAGETSNERAVRRKKIRDSLMGAEETHRRLQKQRISTRRRRQAIKDGVHVPTPRRNPLTNTTTGNKKCGYCDPTEWAAAPYCKHVKVPTKVKFEVTGARGHPVFATANVRDAEFISADVSSLGAEVHYCKREDATNAPRFMFSIRFDNLMADGFRFKCTIDDLPKCEIRINGTIVGTLKECNNSFAKMQPDSDYMSITHQFVFEHGASQWGWYECFALNLLYGPLPKDILTDLRQIVQSTNADGNAGQLNNFCYSQIARKGISTIEFVDIHFRETCMKRDKLGTNSRLHSIAWKAICERNESRSMTDTEAHNIWNEIEKEKNKRKYWKCFNGDELCHKHRLHTKCEDHLRKGLFYIDRHLSLCVAGLSICHDGMMQCPDCRERNLPRNKPQWRCMRCKHISPSYREILQHEDVCVWKHGSVGYPAINPDSYGWITY